MALKATPVCEFDKNAVDFQLQGVDGRQYRLSDCLKKNGLLVMFICNHCPYVKSILTTLVVTTQTLAELEIGCVAICSNDPTDYPEDSFEKMKQVAQQNHFPFPYLVDSTQEIAKAYDAVCTPDFFGYNSNLKLQYRGKLGENSELLNAMKLIARTGEGPKDQVPSQGCSIKWRD